MPLKGRLMLPPHKCCTKLAQVALQRHWSDVQASLHSTLGQDWLFSENKLKYFFIQRHCENVFEVNLHSLSDLTFNLVYPSRLVISSHQTFYKTHLL